MSLEAITEVIRINRDKLVSAGRAKETGRTEQGTALIDIGELAKRASAQLEARARMAVAGTEFKNSEEALRSKKPNPVRRGIARAKWIAKNLPKLVPGRMLSIPRTKEAMSLWNRNAVILDIVPPPERRESQLAQWRVLTVAPGESKPVSITLNALMGDLVTDLAATESAVGGPLDVHAESRLGIGGDLMALHEAPTKAARKALPNAWIYEDFGARWAGTRKRKGLVLNGNMYLASEWAAQTKAGQGVVYTDERGLRHRGILLKDTFKPEWLRFLPARLWMPGMVERFTETLLSGDIEQNTSEGFRVYSSFNGAWDATSQSAVTGRSAAHKDAIYIKPGHGIRMFVGKESRRRVNAMIRQAQKTIKQELFPDRKVTPSEDPGHVVIKESQARARRMADAGEAVSKRGEADWVVMQAETPEKMRRALQMLMRGPGLEIFVPPSLTGEAMSLLARDCMRDYYIERLRADAQGDPVRLAKLEEVIAAESDFDSRADELNRELATLRERGDDAGDSEQVLLDFETGLPVRSGESADGGADEVIDPNELFEAPTPEDGDQVRVERMAA